MTPTIVKCGCCHEGVSSDKTQWDADIQEHVCHPCASDLHNADDAMREEFKTSGCKGEMPKPYTGPFHGKSCG